MKISQLNNEDILNFLMNSEFEDDYSPSELKYLLLKWRYFYRVSQGKNEQLRTHYEGVLYALEEKIKIKEVQETELQIKIVEKDKQIESLKKRKLTWRERFSGKIIENENENEHRGI